MKVFYKQKNDFCKNTWKRGKRRDRIPSEVPSHSIPFSKLSRRIGKKVKKGVDATLEVNGK
jgi:hypothetical protein